MLIIPSSIENCRYTLNMFTWHLHSKKPALALLLVKGCIEKKVNSITQSHYVATNKAKDQIASTLTFMVIFINFKFVI